MSGPDHLDLALHAFGDTCVELAEEGCHSTVVAAALAQMLGVVTAAIACCPEHAAEAEEGVIEIFEHSLATHRARYAALERGGMIHQEGHA